jgi:hypothetical protein
MIRFIFRFLGFWILAAGFIFFVYDGARWLANNRLDVTSVGQVWANIHQESLLLLQPAVERHVAPWLWQSALQPYILEQPAWLVLGILGMLLMLIGRKKRRLIGYARD